MTRLEPLDVPDASTPRHLPGSLELRTDVMFLPGGLVISHAWSGWPLQANDTTGVPLVMSPLSAPRHSRVDPVPSVVLFTQVDMKMVPALAGSGASPLRPTTAPTAAALASAILDHFMGFLLIVIVAGAGLRPAP